MIESFKIDSIVDHNHFLSIMVMIESCALFKATAYMYGFIIFTLIRSNFHHIRRSAFSRHHFDEPIFSLRASGLYEFEPTVRSVFNRHISAFRKPQGTSSQSSIHVGPTIFVLRRRPPPITRGQRKIRTRTNKYISAL